MGLDMYLTKRFPINARYRSDILCDVKVEINGAPLNIDAKRIDYISENFMYWRKANAIHGWFVDNVQEGVDDGDEYWVPFQKLMELKDICKRVLNDKKLAPELLPTREGFFFGSLEYDKYYFYNVQYTYDTLKDIKEELYVEYIYQSSW